MSYANRRAAIQMERDGIRTLKRSVRAKTLCGHVHNPGDQILLRCHKGARYSTPLGNLCWEHASALRTAAKQAGEAV